LFSQDAVKTYNGFKNIIWHGQQYRLQDPYENDVASIAYVDDGKDKSVVFSYFVATRNATRQAIPIKMKGLDNNRQYRLKEVNLYPNTKTPIDDSKIYSGEFLMTVGFNPEANERRTSVIIMVEAIK
jgi:alpha-galactosidase